MRETNKFDFAVVGGGVVGLAVGWMAMRQGLSTVLFERDKNARGASVRNFGMIWPIGQPDGELFEMACRNREFWLQLEREAGLWVNPCGSLHLLRADDEVAIASEFLQSDSRADRLKFLQPREVAAMSNGAKIEGLLGALWSPFECCVNPVEAIAQITNWLRKSDNIRICDSTTITHASDGCLTTSTGERFQAERIAICSGSDFETLFPNEFSDAGLQRCKLQMMSTSPQPNGWQLGPHLAGGLTLRHYESFRNCPSLGEFEERIAREKPELNQFGIHVMASQNNLGEIILGDSHLYDEDISPFDSNEIEQLILKELLNLIDLPNFRIFRRWHGVYAKHPSKHVAIIDVQPDCKIVTATGGCGMSLSFGLAEELLEQW